MTAIDAWVLVVVAATAAIVVGLAIVCAPR
jgi:hypothetical protein